MPLRTWLYRRRFPRALPPLFRSPSLRSLVSTAELAHLLELPSAAMKGVAVSRSAVPRLPADTDVRRAGELRPSWPPPTPRTRPRAGRRQPPTARRSCRGQDQGRADEAAGRCTSEFGCDPFEYRSPDLPEHVRHGTLRAENGNVLLAPSDRKYGALLLGLPGVGKTALALAMYLNDVWDPDAAIVLIDFKSELAGLCLHLTPPECAKRLWYLDLGQPAFAINPLVMDAGERFVDQVSAIGGIVAGALADTSEGQFFESSHRYTDYATGAALAIAHKQGSRHARFQDVSGLLRHDRDDYHAAAARACADVPDLQEIAEFYGSELPAKLRDAKATTAKEMDAPRNKISRLLRNPAMRRFYSHPTNVSLRSIIDARDILIVDANFEKADEKNAVTTAHFLFRMLNRELYRLVKLPQSRAPAGVPVRRRGEPRRQVRAPGRAVRAPPRRRSVPHVLGPVSGADRLRLPAPGEDPQGVHEHAAEQVHLPPGRPSRRRGGRAGGDERVRVADERAGRATTVHARHPRAVPAPPEPLLHRAHDRRRHPPGRVHGQDVPVPGARGRRQPCRVQRRGGRASTSRGWASAAAPTPPSWG